MTQLLVDIDQDLLEMFRKFAVNKHGRIYGVLKPEVELALREHLGIAHHKEIDNAMELPKNDPDHPGCDSQ